MSSRAVSAKPIYVTVPASFGKDRQVQIGDETIPVDVLEERVRQALLESTEKSLFVRGDGDVAYAAHRLRVATS